ncbi:mitochondrial 39-S ribosomal protein L47 (MRP-L47)-domain-containing protein, partial [Irpex lacteus]
EGALRPHLGVEVDPDHGLWAFFRRKTADDGTTKYETVEPLDFAGLQTGRAWTAAELRRKSFKDLHTLWYVLVRERNLLATQREEARRMGIMHNRLDSATKVFRVRKSMARIKYVLNERRLAYEGAIEIHENQATEVLSKREERRQRTKEA